MVQQLKITVVIMYVLKMSQIDVQNALQMCWGEDGEEKGVAVQDFKECHILQISFHLANYQKHESF